MIENTDISSEGEKQEWSSLFNGKDFTGWSATGNADSWKAEDGTILCKGEGGGFLRTHDQFGDFDLELEFNLEPGANSGVFIRWSDISSPVHSGLELQILDTHDTDSLDKHSCGALYDLVAPIANTVRPPGKWNEMSISCRGPLITEQLNGELVMCADIRLWHTAGQNPDGSENKFTDHAWDELPQCGYIGLQDHGDRIRFRDIRVRDVS